MRFETILQALGLDKDYLVDRSCMETALLLDKAENSYNFDAPCPTPPLIARPRKVSASSFEKLLRDPYGFYAEYILKLKPLEDLNKEEDVRDFGNLVHNILGEFNKKYPKILLQSICSTVKGCGKYRSRALFSMLIPLRSTASRPARWFRADCRR